MGWERRYQGAAQHLAALYKSRLFSPLQLGYAEEGQSVTGEQRTHTSRAQPPRALVQATGRRGGTEMTRENNMLPSNKTPILLARKVKWLCRRTKTRESCPHWPDVNYKPQKHQSP